MATARRRLAPLVAIALLSISAACATTGARARPASGGPRVPCVVQATAAEINAVLAFSGEGATIALCQRALLALTEPLRFTAQGQRLFTEGLPEGEDRATLLTAGDQQSTAIDARCADCSGVQVRNVIVDGSRPARGRVAGGAALIEMGGNTANQVVDHVRAREPRGWSAIHVFEGRGFCTGASITHNDIGPAGTAADSHTGAGAGAWADGISLACRNSVVSDNVVTDATDGGIVIFGAPGSRVERNVVRARTRVLMGGINLVDVGRSAFDGDYAGTIVANNTIDAAGAFIKVGIGIGPAIWFAANEETIRGGTVIDNRLQGATMGYGIAVNGVEAFVIRGNTDTASHGGRIPRGFPAPYPGCRRSASNTPPGPFLMTTARAAGEFQPFTDATLIGLICLEPPQEDAGAATPPRAAAAAAAQSPDSDRRHRRWP